MLALRVLARSLPKASPTVMVVLLVAARHCVPEVLHQYYQPSGGPPRASGPDGPNAGRTPRADAARRSAARRLRSAGVGPPPAHLVRADPVAPGVVPRRGPLDLDLVRRPRDGVRVDGRRRAVVPDEPDGDRNAVIGLCDRAGRLDAADAGDLGHGYLRNG